MNNIVFKDCRITFKNFSGEATQYNAAGNRNFCLLLSPEDAANMEVDGYNIKRLKPTPDFPDPTPYVQVKVLYGDFPPNIYKVVNGSVIQLDEETVGELDRCRITKCDIQISPYEWNINGKRGIKAYLRTGYFTVEENDPFRASYFGESVGNEELPF